MSDSKRDEKVKPSVPEFRFVQLQPRQEAEIADSNVIDKNSFLDSAASGRDEGDDSKPAAHSSIWSPHQLKAVPAFYPLEKSSRLVEDDTPAGVAARLSDCLRNLSIHAVYGNDTACLTSAENVEMHLSLWKTPPNSSQDGIVVELQRRSGDSIAFHRYSRSILDAAMGLFEDFPADHNVVYSKRVQRLMSIDREGDDYETAIQAVEIAHGLLMKDRMDARVLGLESLCLLTDPRTTGLLTSLLTAHVVLLGSTQGVQLPETQHQAYTDEGPFQEIRESILNLVQFSRIGEEDDMMHDEAEQMTLLHNLALAVLANSLDVIEQPELADSIPEDTNRVRIRSASSTEVANDFLQQTEEMSSKELLSTLISELGKASLKPHNAVLSAKCIGSLCRATNKAKKRSQELGAKQVVATALDVGVRTHLKLETECTKVQTVLERTASEEDGTHDEDEN